MFEVKFVLVLVGPGRGSKVVEYQQPAEVNQWLVPLSVWLTSVLPTIRFARPTQGTLYS